jgi:hypothetical protein
MHIPPNHQLFELQNEKGEIPLIFKDFTRTYSWPNMGSLRKMAFESEKNGLKKAFLKIGRRRLVLPETLFRLLREKGSK